MSLCSGEHNNNKDSAYSMGQESLHQPAAGKWEGCGLEEQHIHGQTSSEVLLLSGLHLECCADGGRRREMRGTRNMLKLINQF